MGSKDKRARAEPTGGGALSAMITEPPSAAKLTLIRDFLRLVGLQARIDTGAFLERHVGALLQDLAEHHPSMRFGDAFSAPMAALREAYAKHREAWQAEYESHANWEFTEEELREIVRFFDSAAGRHYLEGRWRMDAYIGTNTERIEIEIVAEARRLLRLPPANAPSP